MNKEIDAKRLLLELGFPFHSADLYICVLDCGSIPLDSLYRKFSGINDFEMSLNWLLEYGYVYEEIDDRGVRYYKAIAPLILSKALLDNFLWLKLRFHIMSDEDIDHMPLQDRKKFYDYKKRCDDLVEKLTSKSQRITEGLMYIKSEKQLSSVLTECIMNASHDIFGVVVPKWAPNLPLIWESLKHKIKQGVRYRRMSDELTFAAFGYLINKRDTERIGVELKVLERTKIHEKFYIVDDRAAIIFWPSFPYHFEFEATFIDNRSLVRKFLEKAEKMWASGISAKEVLNYLAKLRSEFLKRCEDDLVASKVAEEVFDYGIFSNFRKFSSTNQKIQNVLDNLAKQGLLMKIKLDYYPYARTCYIPNIQSQILSFLRTKNGEFSSYGAN